MAPSGAIFVFTSFPLLENAMSSAMPARVLIIAGSDSGGGAGIQADIKTVTALGGYASTAITALTAQNTLGVHGVMPVAPAFVAQQIEVVLSDIGADVIKTGMLHDAAVIEAVADSLRRWAPGVPLVVDPVMVAQSGDSLIQEPAVAALTDILLPMATLITPNIPEAEVLLGRAIPDEDHMAEAAGELAARFSAVVLLKGGHLAGSGRVRDVLAGREGIEAFESERLHTRNNHGTGCTLASALACGIGQGLALNQTVTRARAYLFEALRQAPDLGRGAGPVAHGHTLGAGSAWPPGV